MQVRAFLALAMLAMLAGAACESGPAERPAQAPSGAAQSEDREGTSFYVVDAVDAQTAFVYGTDDDEYSGSFVLKTSDGGATWACVLRTTESEFVALDFADAQNGVAVADGGALFVTSDGGATWTASSDAGLWAQRFDTPAGTVGALGTVDLFGLSFAGALDGWAFGVREQSQTSGNRIAVALRPAVYRTTDGGVTWKEQPVGAEVEGGLRRGHFVDARSGCLIGGSIDDDEPAVVLKTSDGGATWKAVTPQGDQMPTDVFFADASRGWLVGVTEDKAGDPGPSQVFATADGGESWQAAARLPTSLLSVSFVDAQNGWACGRGAKIYRTSDGGATWTEQPTQDWTTGQTLEADDPQFPAGKEPTIAAFKLLAPGRGWAVSDKGIHEYRAK